MVTILLAELPLLRDHTMRAILRPRFPLPMGNESETKLGSRRRRSLGRNPSESRFPGTPVRLGTRIRTGGWDDLRGWPTRKNSLCRCPQWCYPRRTGLPSGLALLCATCGDNRATMDAPWKSLPKETTIPSPHKCVLTVLMLGKPAVVLQRSSWFLP